MKRVINIFLAFIAAAAGCAITCFLLGILLEHHKEGMWYSVFYVEYPALLAGALILLHKFTDSRNFGEISSMMIFGFMCGCGLTDIFGYIFVLSYVFDHTTIYSKFLYSIIICFIFYEASKFFTKKNKKIISAIMIVIAALLVPGGIIINDSFEKRDVQLYAAVVTNKEEIQSSKSVSFYIYLKGSNDKLPIKRYSAEDIYEYNEYNKGDIVVIEKYRGVLGLPAVSMKKYIDMSAIRNKI